MENLKPCPFCGSNNLITLGHGIYNPTTKIKAKDTHSIMCQGCSSCWYPLDENTIENETEVIKRWNTRAEQAARKEPIVESEKANFLWPHSDDSLDQFLYEFANTKTEEYRKEIYNSLKDKIKIIIANEIKFAIEQSKPEALVPIDRFKLVQKLGEVNCEKIHAHKEMDSSLMISIADMVVITFGTHPAKKLPSLEDIRYLIYKELRNENISISARQADIIGKAILDLFQE